MSRIQGLTLEVTVVKCNNLKDVQYISRQDPYVCLEYGSSRFRTRTCTDGDKNPLFHEKFVFTLFEGLREINISVYNSNTFRGDDFLGRGRVDLHKVISQGCDDSAWPLFRDSGKSAGEVCLILRCPNIKASSSYLPPAPPYVQPMAYYQPYPSVPPPPYQQPPAPYPPYLPPPQPTYQQAAPYPPPNNLCWQCHPMAPSYYGPAYPQTQPPYCQHGRSSGIYPPPPY